MLTRIVAKQAKTTKVKNKFVNGKKSSKEYSVVFFCLFGGRGSSNLPCRFCLNSVGTPLEFAAFCSGFDAKYSRASAFWFFSVHNHGFYSVLNTFCQEKHQHFHADKQLITKKEIIIKIIFITHNKCSWPSGLVSGLIRRRPGFGSFVFSFVFFLI